MNEGLIPAGLHQGSLSSSYTGPLIQDICSPTQSFWVQCHLTTFGHFSTFCFPIQRLDPLLFPKALLLSKVSSWLSRVHHSPEWGNKSSFPSLSSCQTTLQAHESEGRGSYCYWHFIVLPLNDAAQRGRGNSGQEGACRSLGEPQGLGRAKYLEVGPFRRIRETSWKESGVRKPKDKAEDGTGR